MDDDRSTSAYILVYERDEKTNIKLVKHNEEDEQFIKKVMGFNPFLASDDTTDPRKDLKEEEKKKEDDEDEDVNPEEEDVDKGEENQ